MTPVRATRTSSDFAKCYEFASHRCRVAANVVMRQGGATPFTFPELFFAVATHVARCEIVENAIAIASQDDGGIVAAGGDVLIARNEIRSTATFDPAFRPAFPRGVFAYVGEADAIRCVVRDNLFTGLQQAVLAGSLTAPTPRPRVDVVANRIQGAKDLQAMATVRVGNAGLSPVLTALINSLLYGSIVVDNVEHACVAANEIDTVLCGAVCFSSPELRASDNRIVGSTFGIITDASDADLSDNVIEKAALVGVALAEPERTVVRRNALRDCQIGLLDFGSRAIRIDANHVRGGWAGILQVLATDADIRGNAIEEASKFGIIIGAALSEVTVSDNRVQRCGYDTTSTSGAGIVSLLTLGRAVIDSNHVLNTGESSASGAPVFLGRRLGVIAGLAAAARVHGCVITSPSLDSGVVAGGPGPNAASRALAIVTLPPTVLPLLARWLSINFPTPSVHATDNIVQQTTKALVQIVAWRGEVVFASNVCTNLVTANPGVASVLLAALNVVVNGNRVTAAGNTPSLRVATARAIAAVGNMTTRGATIAAVAPVPAPYASFNVIT